MEKPASYLAGGQALAELNRLVVNEIVSLSKLAASRDTHYAENFLAPLVAAFLEAEAKHSNEDEPPLASPKR